MPQLSQVGSSRHRVTARSFHRLLPPPALRAGERLARPAQVRLDQRRRLRPAIVALEQLAQLERLRGIHRVHAHEVPPVERAGEPIAPFGGAAFHDNKAWVRKAAV